MTDPITIYECQECGRISEKDFSGVMHADLGGYCPGRPVPVHLFREEPVRRLYEAAAVHRAWGTPMVLSRALDAFPAPEDWKR